MAEIVLVHGIAQEQHGPAKLLSDWLPALSDGVGSAVGRHHDLVERIWSTRRGGTDLDIQMAYYADPLAEVGAQGNRLLDADAAVETNADGALVEALALEWLAEAALRADDPVDRRVARNELAALQDGVEPQGLGNRLRPVVNAVAGVRWFAPYAMVLAERFVWTALTQVSRYFDDPEFRTYAQDEVLRWIGEDTRLVIGHSLGSVVAYEALHRNHHPLVFATAGSPLGLRNVIYERLHIRPPRVPDCVLRWDNLVAEDDLVAARPNLAEQFPRGDKSLTAITLHLVDNGSAPHDALHYLSKKQMGHVVADATGGRG